MISAACREQQLPGLSWSSQNIYLWDPSKWKTAMSILSQCIFALLDPWYRMKLQSLLVVLAACAPEVLSMKYTDTQKRFHPPRPLNNALPATTGNGTFQQVLDHDNPSAGNFSQRFWWSDQYWGGPGSPVVLFTPGEIAADGYQGYLTNSTITGHFAQAIQGAVVMLEHRYWGESSPYDELTTKNLQQHTLKNAIADLTYFAKTVQLPFDSNSSSNAPQAPWVLSGGSYSGALSAWTEATAPGTFWAYHASSAPVEAIYDYVRIQLFQL